MYKSTFNMVQKSIHNNFENYMCNKIDTPVQCFNEQQFERKTVEDKTITKYAHSIIYNLEIINVQKNTRIVKIN